MFSTALIIFRETIEIAMILGVVLAATKSVAGRNKWILLGLAGGIAGACLVALSAGALSRVASGMGQELFNAIVLFTAAVFIAWTVIWMKTHAREMVLQMKQVGHEVNTGKLPHYSLSLIIGLAILREGSEIVMFVYGLILSGQPVSDIITGSIAGIVSGSVAGFMLYISLVKMSLRYMLTFTNWLLILLVCGLTAQGAGFLSAAGYFSEFSVVMWNSSWLIEDSSFTGKALHSLVGYTSHPTQIELLFYSVTLLAIVGILKYNAQPHVKKTAVAG